jgi:hypothetical protein
MSASTAAIAARRRGGYLYLLAVDGKERVTSEYLSERLGIHATLVRRDLSSLGVGRRGVGYESERLRGELAVSGRVAVLGDGPIAAVLREGLRKLEPAGLLPAEQRDADVALLDGTDEESARWLAQRAAADGVSLIVNYGDWVVEAPPARVVNASPLLEAVRAVA